MNRSQCRWPGCTRTGLHHYDKFCTRHDGHDHGPLVCVCRVARPRPFPECDRCKRAVVGLWPPDRYRAAIRAYPQLAHQTIDWGLRTRGAPRGRGGHRMGTDCGHRCCDQRSNPYHSHSVDPDTCLICQTVRDTGRIPTVVITTERATDVQHETPS